MFGLEISGKIVEKPGKYANFNEFMPVRNLIAWFKGRIMAAAPKEATKCML